ncbi:MAG: ATP-binding protein [Lachnospiraceae bacterium]|nr:ATP-binding protein [Lachnospiraceae bacterium]
MEKKSFFSSLKVKVFALCSLFGLLPMLFLWFGLGGLKEGTDYRMLFILIPAVFVMAFALTCILIRPIKKMQDDIVQSRQDFISNVSHELKTPMASMKVLADSLVMQEEVPSEMYQEFLINIGQEIDRENAIIADLTNLSKLDRKDVQMNVSEVNVEALLSMIIRRVAPIAGKRDIEIALEAEEDIVAELDEVKMTMAFTNLIENAVKYNKEHGTVLVSMHAEGNDCVVSIRDSGIGIPKEALDKIFERFYRVDKSRSREIGGTGLGLSLAQTVVELHRGEITVESEIEEGSTFTVRVPIKREAEKNL